MKIGRRGFLGALGLSPLAAKAAADKAVADLTAVRADGLGGSGAFGSPVTAASETLATTTAQRRLALSLPGARAEIESLLYQEHKHVFHLDPDIAAKRSFSLAAKVTFQRQRNVARALNETWLDDTPYSRLRAAFARWAGMRIG